MALPKLNTPTHEMEIPSTGEKLKYRPWLIKEQKILMMAQESAEDKEIETAFANIVRECTFGKIDPYDNPLFDIEYIFLQLRSKSVGQKVKLNLLCSDDEKTRVEYELDLGDVAVQMPDNHTNIIKITDDISMIMRYPKLSDMSKFNGEGQIEQSFEMIKRCVVEIRDGDVIHTKIDMSDSELEEFLDSMSQSSFEFITNFFDTMPKLIHEVTVINPKTKKKNNITIAGLQSFF